MCVLVKKVETIATIDDVARDANVSISTVSKVLNGTGKISEQTRRTVLASAERLGYRRKRLRNHRPKGTSHTVGLVIPSISNPFFPLLADSVERTLLEADYNMFLCNTGRNEHVEIGYIRRLIERSVDGIIVFSPSHRAIEFIQSVGYGHTEFVAIEEPIDPVTPQNFIEIDNAKGMSEAVNYVLSQKHSRIAYITGPLERACNKARLDVFRETLEKHQVPIIEEFIQESNFEYDGGYNLGWQLLRHPDPPTAIFAGNDMMAFGIINAITEQGYRVPEDISVIGFDDIPQASYFIPALTTVRQPAKELGKMAAWCILNKLAARETFDRIVVPTSLVIRKSSGYCRKE